jgi:hypothetical protein
MNYMTKRILLVAGLTIIYWGVLFNYQEATENVLKVLGAWYLGLLMFRTVTWLVPKENISEQKN